jgi:hypothetical protein
MTGFNVDVSNGVNDETLFKFLNGVLTYLLLSIIYTVRYNIKSWQWNFARARLEIRRTSLITHELLPILKENVHKL